MSAAAVEVTQGWARDIVEAWNGGDETELAATLELYGGGIAAAYLNTLSALEPFLRIAGELVESRDASDTWKLAISDDQAIFGFCGETVTAGDLRRLLRACAKSRHSLDAGEQEKAP